LSNQLTPLKIITAVGILICLSIYGCKKENNTSAEDIHAAMLADVNALRSTGCTCGTTYMPPVPPVKWNNILATAAAGHAKDMYVNNYFSHIAPNGSSPIQRAQDDGYTGMYMGENIATGYNTVAQVMDAWEKSEDHCKAMMDSTYVDFGAARYNSIWVQEFGR